MFCPICKGEFVPDVTICNSCDVELVNALPETPPPPSLELVPLLTFLQPVDAQMAACYLEANGVAVVTKDAHTLGLNWLFSTALGGVQIAVPRAQVDDARELLAARETPTTSAFEPDEFAGGHVPSAELEHSTRTNRFKALLTLLLFNPLVFLLGLVGYLARDSKKRDVNDSDNAA